MNRPRPSEPVRDQQGTTLLELLVSLAIFSVVMFVIYASAEQMMRIYSTSSTALGLEDRGRSALNRMVKEIRTAGITDHPSHPGNPDYAYPYVWTNNNPVGPYTGYALSSGELPLDTIDSYDPNDAAVGPNSGIVFKTPITDGTTLTDGGGNPIPLVQSGGELQIRWGGRVRTDDPLSTHGIATDGVTNNEIAYLLVRDPGGGDFNVLQRRESATGRTEILCRHVERIEFAYYMRGGIAQQSQISMKLYLRNRDGHGHWISADVSAVVAMRSINAE